MNDLLTFIALCFLGGLIGTAIGVVLAEPERAFLGLGDGLLRTLGWPVQAWRRHRSARR